MIPFPRRGLYALTAPAADPATLAERVTAAIEGGADAVQYRAKDRDPDTSRAEAAALVTVCRARGVPLVINDRVDLAAHVGADGVHLGRDDDTAENARRVLGDAAIVGVSCYDSIERARAARDAGASYVAFGSFYASAVKPDAVRAPLVLLGEARALGMPIVAIGGITPENAATLVTAGADVLAVITAVFGGDDPRAAARRFAGALGPARPRGLETT